MQLGLLLLYVDDFPTMLRYYRDVLGFELTDVDPGAGYEPGRDWVQFRIGGGELELFDRRVHGGRRELPLPRANASVITFRVHGIEAVAERLRRRGAELPPVSYPPWGAAVHFRDPEGNELQLYEPGAVRA